MAQAELALADYNKNKRGPMDRLMRNMVLGLIGLAGLTLLVALWRLLTMVS
jgi:hypothetical protein